jgi:predicted membrane protein (TIGR00267 family)
MIGNFLRGYIDGSLSTLGIVIGASSASSPIIIAAAVGGTLANGISNVLSAISASEAEQHKHLRDVERAMVDKELKGSEADRMVSRQSKAAGVVDGMATIIGGAIPVIPLLFLRGTQAIITSAALVIFLVFIIGIYLGKISKRNILFSAIKMAASAVMVALAVYFIQIVIVR